MRNILPRICDPSSRRHHPCSGAVGPVGIALIDTIDAPVTLSEARTGGSGVAKVGLIASCLILGALLVFVVTA